MTKTANESLTEPPKQIVFVGDLHCGSHGGLWPVRRLPEYPNHSGVRYLMDCWQHALRRLPKKIPLLVLTGDLCDGPQWRSKHTGVFSARMGDQVDAAIEVLEPLCRRANTIIRVDGTPYHEEYHGAVEKLDVALGVDLLQQVVDLSLGDLGILNVAHHPMGGATLYSGTKLDRERIWATLAKHEKKVPDARWIVRAHLHHYSRIELPQHEVVQLPCWKLPGPWDKKSNYWKWQPDLGLTVMERDDRTLHGYRFRPYLYDPPMPEVHTMETIHAS